MISWESVEPKHPYTATEHDWEAERIKADIEINGELIDFEFFHVPPNVDFDYWTHVVRANTDAGRKSKDVFVTANDELYMKNRGTPWNESKQWTYLSPGELQHRSEIARLGEVIDDPDPDSEGRYGVLLGVDDRPLVVDGEIQEDLLLQLAKALLVFKSKQNPAAK